MSKIKIKLLSDTALAYFKRNMSKMVVKIQENETNDWVYKDFSNPIFVQKEYQIEDFELMPNPESADKEIDLNNSIVLYETLKSLPKYILTDERFWLWLYLDKCYTITRSMMKVTGKSTLSDHWTFAQGVRRGLMFGVLSRCYYRVLFTVDPSKEDKYELTKWIIQFPERYRNLTWRSFSSEAHLVRGILKGEKRAVEETGRENSKFYSEIAKYIMRVGSVKLLDVITEEDIEDITYNKMIELYNAEEVNL